MLDFYFVVENRDSTETKTATYSPDLEKRLGCNDGFLKTRIAFPKAQDLLHYTNFSILFSKPHKLPIYTVVNVDGASNELSMEHEARGTDKWFVDPRVVGINNPYQFNDADYKGSGLQKGHMVRYYEPGWGDDSKKKKIAMGDTFHYTNACPQVPYFNSVSWNYLEDYCMARGIFINGKVTIYSGPFLKNITKISQLSVPHSFWKVLVYNKPEGGIGALGFVMSQEKHIQGLSLTFEKMVKPTLKREDVERLFKEKKLFELVVGIHLIEEKTGLNFGLSAYDEGKGLLNGTYQELVARADAKSLKYLLMEDQEVDYSSFLQNL